MRSRNGTGDDVVAVLLNLSGRETSLLSLYCPATGLVILPRRAKIHRSNTCLADTHTHTHTFPASLETLGSWKEGSGRARYTLRGRDT